MWSRDLHVLTAGHPPPRRARSGRGPRCPSQARGSAVTVLPVPSPALPRHPAGSFLARGLFSLSGPASGLPSSVGGWSVLRPPWRKPALWSQPASGCEEAPRGHRSPDACPERQHRGQHPPPPLLHVDHNVNVSEPQIPRHTRSKGSFPRASLRTPLPLTGPAAGVVTPAPPHTPGPQSRQRGGRPPPLEPGRFPRAPWPPPVPSPVDCHPGEHRPASRPPVTHPSTPAPCDACAARSRGGPSTAPAHRAPPSGGNAPCCPRRECRPPCSPPGPLGPATAVPHLLSASQTCGALPCASARAEAARTRPGFRGGLRVSCRPPARRPAHAVLPNGVPREATRDQAIVTNGSHWVQAHLAPLADGRQKSRRPVCEDPLGGEKAASTVLSIR